MTCCLYAVDLCLNKDTESSPEKRSAFSDGKGFPTAEESFDGATADGGATRRQDEFKPLLLFIPLRLGLDAFERQYSEPLKVHVWHA